MYLWKPDRHMDVFLVLCLIFWNTYLSLVGQWASGSYLAYLLAGIRSLSHHPCPFHRSKHRSSCLWGMHLLTEPSLQLLCLYLKWIHLLFLSLQTSKVGCCLCGFNGPPSLGSSLNKPLSLSLSLSLSLWYSLRSAVNLPVACVLLHVCVYTGESGPCDMSSVGVEAAFGPSLPLIVNSSEISRSFKSPLYRVEE